MPDTIQPMTVKDTITALQDLAHGKGIASCAGWVKTLLRSETVTVVNKATLLEAFGQAFSSSEVGLLGEDVVCGRLRDDHLVIRTAALSCLERWILDADPQGPDWVEWLYRLAKEGDLKTKAGETDVLRARAQSFLEEIGAPSEEGSWDTQPLNYITARLEGSLVPKFLDRMLDMSQQMSLAFLESLQVGHLCLPTHNLKHVELYEICDDYRLCGMLQNGQSFCLETDTAADKYVVYVYL